MYSYATFLGKDYLPHRTKVVEISEGIEYLPCDDDVEELI